MIDLTLDFLLKKLGWMGLQFLWISTLYLGSIFIALRLLQPFNMKFSYYFGIGALFSLPLIPLLLGISHKGFLPPVGLADWGEPSAGQAVQEPLIHGLPQISGVALDPSWHYWLGILWAVSALLVGSYYLLSTLLLVRRCRKKPLNNDPVIGKCLDEIAGYLHIPANLEIRETRRNESPGVVGFVRPCILVPDSLSDDYSHDEIKSLLLHELIHIKRKDYLMSILQLMTKSLFVLQPLVWGLSRRVNHDREHICDQHVSEITGDPYQYGQTLVKLHLRTQLSWAHSLHFSGTNTSSRLQKLIDHERNRFNPRQKHIRWIFACMITGITLFCTIWNSYHLHF